MKRGRPIGSKYKKSANNKRAKQKDNLNEDIESLKESYDIIDF